MLLQYTDDLIAAANMDTCTLATEELLEPLQWLDVHQEGPTLQQECHIFVIPWREEIIVHVI